MLSVLKIYLFVWWLIYLFIDLKYQYMRNRERKEERKRQREDPPSDSFPKQPTGCSRSGLKLGAQNSILLSMWVAGARMLGLSSANFQGRKLGQQWSSQDWNKPSNMGCQCHRWQLSPLHHEASPNTAAILIFSNCQLFSNHLKYHNLVSLMNNRCSLQIDTWCVFLHSSVSFGHCS